MIETLTHWEGMCLALVHVMVKTPDHRAQAHSFQLLARKQAVVNLSLVKPFDLRIVKEARGKKIGPAVTTRLSVQGGARQEALAMVDLTISRHGA